MNKALPPTYACTYLNNLPILSSKRDRAESRLFPGSKLVPNIPTTVFSLLSVHQNILLSIQINHLSVKKINYQTVIVIHNVKILM